MLNRIKPYRKSTKILAKRKTGLSLIAKNAVSLGKKDLAGNFNKYFEASLK